MHFDHPFQIAGRLTVFYRAFAVGIAGLYDNVRTYKCHSEEARLRLDESMFLSVAHAIGGADPDFMEACSLLSSEYASSIKTMGTIYGRRRLLSFAVDSATRVVGAGSLAAGLISDLCLTDHVGASHTMGMIGVPEKIPSMIAIGIDAGISPISASMSTSEDHLLYIAAKCLEIGVDRSGINEISGIGQEWILAMRMCCLPTEDAISPLKNSLRKSLIRDGYRDIWKMIQSNVNVPYIDYSIGNALYIASERSKQRTMAAASRYTGLLYHQDWVPSSEINRLARDAAASCDLLNMKIKISSDPKLLLLDRLGTRLVR
jgi:hypothetical protein